MAEPSPDDLRWMARSIELAAACEAEPRSSRDAPPKVGAVLVRDGRLLAEGYRGKTGPGDHAEFGILEKDLANVDATGSVLYTTLEPCSRRSPDKTPCCERIVERRVAIVWIGCFDPDPRITREGWRYLHEHELVLRDYPSGLRSRAREANQVFVDQFRGGVGDTGSARFDYTANDGRFTVSGSSAGIFETRWTSRGPAGIYALDYNGLVSAQRYASSFEDIDDPEAVAFETYTLPIDEGGIAIFRNDAGYLLIRVEDVKAAPTDAYPEISISWEVRRRQIP